MTLCTTLAGIEARAGAPSSADFAGAKVAVFGFVQDGTSEPVNGAVVTADVKNLKLKIVGRSDITGAYTLYKVGNDNDRLDVTITCAKDGYRFEKQIARNMVVPPGQPVEINCIMTKK